MKWLYVNIGFLFAVVKSHSDGTCHPQQNCEDAFNSAFRQILSDLHHAEPMPYPAAPPYRKCEIITKRLTFWRDKPICKKDDGKITVAKMQASDVILKCRLQLLPLKLILDLTHITNGKRHKCLVQSIFKKLDFANRLKRLNAMLPKACNTFKDVLLGANPNFLDDSEHNEDHHHKRHKRFLDLPGLGNPESLFDSIGSSPFGKHGGKGDGGLPLGLGGSVHGGLPLGLDGGLQGGLPLGLGGGLQGGLPLGLGGGLQGGLPLGLGGGLQGGLPFGLGGGSQGGLPFGLDKFLPFGGGGGGGDDDDSGPLEILEGISSSVQQVAGLEGDVYFSLRNVSFKLTHTQGQSVGQVIVSPIDLSNLKDAQCKGSPIFENICNCFAHQRDFRVLFLDVKQSLFPCYYDGTYFATKKEYWTWPSCRPQTRPHPPPPLPPPHHHHHHHAHPHPHHHHHHGPPPSPHHHGHHHHGPPPSPHHHGHYHHEQHH